MIYFFFVSRSHGSRYHIYYVRKLLERKIIVSRFKLSKSGLDSGDVFTIEIEEGMMPRVSAYFLRRAGGTEQLTGHVSSSYNYDFIHMYVCLYLVCSIFSLVD